MSSLSKPRWAFAFAALVIGTAYSASLLGWRSLDVTNLDWLHGDPQQSYLGWAFMRAEQGWSWPPTWIDRLNYPFGLSAAYTDAIPLAALLFKPLAAFLPDPFQYSGIWLALCCGLQTWAGFLLARSVGAKDALQVFLVGLLFLLAPVFTWRLHVHFALSAHWLLLFSFYLYLSPPTHLTKWLALILTASLINPYLTVMAVMIFAAFLLKRRLIENVAWTKLAGASAAGIGVLAFGWLLAGFVVLGRAPSFQGPGLGYYSANLLALIDAGDQGAMLGYSFTKGPGQYEGNGYLGVGVAVLICAALLGVRKVSWRKDRYSFGPLAFWVFLAFLVALSFKIMLGAIVVYDYGGKLPQALISAWSAFRASGRFIWLLHYAILITSLVLLFRASRPKFATFLLALAVALQVYDLTPLRESVRSIVAMPGQTQLSDGVWMGLGEDHKHLVALPAWQCGPSKGPLGGNDFWALGLLVLREGMTLNSHYAARVTPEGQRYNCGDLVKRVVEGERLADTAYVFSLPMVRTLIAREMTSGCRLVDGVALCAPGLPELPPASGWPSVIAPYQLGSRIDLSNAGGADPYLGAGWSERSEAAKGLTTIGHLASLVLRLIEPLPDEAELVVEFGGAGAPPNAAFPLKVRVNGREVASMLLPIGVELQPLRLTLPSDLAATAGLLEIEFLVELPPVGEDEPQWPYHSLEVRALEIR